MWSPQRGAEARHVPGATTLILDPRVRHFWDPGALAGTAFAPAVGTDVPAWDVWMLFDQRSVWKPGSPPTPAWWEHQLGGLPDERHLEPRRFADRAMALERAGGSPLSPPDQ